MPYSSACAKPSASRSAPTTTTRAGKSGSAAASSRARRFDPAPEMRTATVSTGLVYRRQRLRPAGAEVDRRRAVGVGARACERGRCGSRGRRRRASTRRRGVAVGLGGPLARGSLRVGGATAVGRRRSSDGGAAIGRPRSTGAASRPGAGVWRGVAARAAGWPAPSSTSSPTASATGPGCGPDLGEAAGSDRAGREKRQQRGAGRGEHGDAERDDEPRADRAHAAGVGDRRTASTAPSPLRRSIRALRGRRPRSASASASSAVSAELRAASGAASHSDGNGLRLRGGSRRCGGRCEQRERAIQPASAPRATGSSASSSSHGVVDSGTTPRTGMPGITPSCVPAGETAVPSPTAKPGPGDEREPPDDERRQVGELRERDHDGAERVDVGGLEERDRPRRRAARVRPRTASAPSPIRPASTTAAPRAIRARARRPSRAEPPRSRSRSAGDEAGAGLAPLGHDCAGEQRARRTRATGAGSPARARPRRRRSAEVSATTVARRGEDDGAGRRRP